MKILIQGATLFDSGSTFHQQEKNILISDGRIAEIGDKNWAADKVIRAKGMILSCGWFDLGTMVGDPGLEHKEDLSSATAAAEAGGFTGLAVLPNTTPCVQTKNEVAYLSGGNHARLVQVFPLAAVTRNNKGEELTEMIDLHTSGAVGFTDGLKPVWHTDILLKSLQYLQKFDGVLIDHPEDIWLNVFGQMHEGLNSTMLGLKGMPRVAEDISIIRNLEILSYSGGRLHFSRLSSGKAVDLVRSAKKRMKVTCDITGYQTLFDDSALRTFDTNYKVNPPFREKADNDALIRGLKDGTIDVICSGHLPQDEESKNVEFDLADAGIINLQTFGANLVALARQLDWELLIEKVTRNPRRILNLEAPVIEKDRPANLTLLDPEKRWRLDGKSNLSKSANSPWFGKEVTGKVVAVFNNGRYVIHN